MSEGGRDWSAGLVAALVAWLVSLAAGAALADSFDTPGEGPLEVTADRLDYDHQRQLYVAAGHVRFLQGDRTLEADWVAFSTQTNTGVASGHVRIEGAGDVLSASFFEFELDTFQGVVFDANLDAGARDFLIQARQLEKTGDGTYRLKEAVFTTCRCPDDERLPWRLRAKAAEFEIGGYATTRNTTAEVLGVPALWLPWLIFPIKTKRQSGLLFPEFGIGGNNGFEVGLPIFWAAHEQLNVTLTPRYLSKRGFKPNLDFEYVLGKRSGGRLFGSFIHDIKVADVPKDERLFSPNRWAAIWNHDQHLPGGWRFKADVKLASDNDHPVDFEELEKYRNYRYIESSLFAFNHFGADGRFGTTAAVRWADDKQAADTIDRDPFLLQRLPDVSGDVLPGGVPLVPGLVASLGADYTYFHSRKDPVDYLGLPSVNKKAKFLDVGFDALPSDREIGFDPSVMDDDPYGDDVRFAADTGRFEGNTDFDEGEPLNDRGSRLALHPRFAYPLWFFDRFELYPEIGYYETLYSADRVGFEHRGLVTGRVDLRTRLAGKVDLPFVEPLQHLMDARASWTYVQNKESSQLDNAFFIPPTAVPQEFLRQLEPENIVLDNADIIPRANLLTLSFANRLYAPGRRANRLLADVTFSAGYDFARERWARVNVDGSTFPRDGLATRFMMSLDPNKPRLEEALMEASMRLPRLGWFKGGAAGLAYRYRRQLPLFYDNRKGKDIQYDPDPAIDRVNQIGLFARLNLGPRWRLGYAFSYSLAGELLLQNRGGVSYTSTCRCWTVTVEARQDRVRDVEVRVGFSLLGLGDTVGAANRLFH